MQQGKRARLRQVVDESRTSFARKISKGVQSCPIASNCLTVRSAPLGKVRSSPETRKDRTSPCNISPTSYLSFNPIVCKINPRNNRSKHTVKVARRTRNPSLTTDGRTKELVQVTMTKQRPWAGNRPPRQIEIEEDPPHQHKPKIERTRIEANRFLLPAYVHRNPNS